MRQPRGSLLIIPASPPISPNLLLDADRGGGGSDEVLEKISSDKERNDNKITVVAIPQTAPKAQEPFHLWTDLSSGYERWDPRSA